jgi:hypothetical protein
MNDRVAVLSEYTSSSPPAIHAATGSCCGTRFTSSPILFAWIVCRCPFRHVREWSMPEFVVHGTLGNEPVVEVAARHFSALLIQLVCLIRNAFIQVLITYSESSRGRVKSSHNYLLSVGGRVMT